MSYPYIESFWLIKHTSNGQDRPVQKVVYRNDDYIVLESYDELEMLKVVEIDEFIKNYNQVHYSNDEGWNE